MSVSPELPKFRLGDVVRLRKPHPCGDDRWEVVRVGADFRLRCLGCGRYVLVPRRKFERAVKEILGSIPDGYQPEPPPPRPRRR
ncbi:MAG: DUF951 domain-containing protein [Thermaerobacter sp.]|nr:DUF951 domain-containing protein [Bacillota bacterium]REJ37729.1 MAG: DUF951 domain-containing protein [Bacillota bacterium]